MLYSEFLEGTGCKDRPENYQVYKDLEIIYMNSDKTKAEIYEYGRKLVDNSKTPEQKRFEKQVQDEINAYKNMIQENNAEINYRKTLADLYKLEGDAESYKRQRGIMKYYRQKNREHRERIRWLKWTIEE